jgi:hypothetical protein
LVTGHESSTDFLWGNFGHIKNDCKTRISKAEQVLVFSMS